MLDIRVCYKITRADVFGATRFYFSRTGRWWRMGVSLLWLVVGAFSLLVPDVRFFGILLLLCAALQLASPRINAYAMVRRYFSNPSLGRDFQTHLTDDGIATQSELGAGSQSWDLFKSWMEAPGSFLLIIYKGHFVVVPKHGFAGEEDIATFRDFLSQTIGRDTPRAPAGS